MAAAVTALTLAGCNTTPLTAAPEPATKAALASTAAPTRLAHPSTAATPAEAVACPVPQAHLQLPSGIDTDRLNLIDARKPVRVFVEALRFGDGAEDKALFPSEMAARTEFSKGGLTRLLADTILQARRFEVHDIATLGVGTQTRYLISSRILEAVQSWQPIEGGRRRAQVRVTMSVQMLDVGSGRLAFPAAVLVEGKTGLGSGDGTVVGPLDNVDSPATQRALTADYHNALRRAFREASYRIAEIVRPVASVRNVAACDVDFFGGSTFGVQPGDELVLFKATKEQSGNREVLASTQAVARVKCYSVGTDYMKCRTVSRVPGQFPKKGDYGIVTDESMRNARLE